MEIEKSEEKISLGFVGFGEASINIVEGLKDYQELSIYAYDKNPKQANIKSYSNVNYVSTIDELLNNSNTIIVAIPGKEDKKLFLSITGNIKGHLFIDICTTSPKDKIEISKIVEKMEGMYVDAAVMGSIPKYKNEVPILMSGKYTAHAIKVLEPLKFNIKKCGDEVGKASSIKLCRSVFMKGLPALFVETKNISEKYGVEKEVLDSIYDSFKGDSFENNITRIVNSAYKNRIRQEKELEECKELEEFKESPSFMTEGAMKIYEKIIGKN